MCETGRSALACLDRERVYQGMTDQHPTHKAKDLIDSTSNFEIWPFTNGTHCPITDVQEPHLHDFFVVHYVTAGSGVCVVDFQPYDIVPDHLYFVSPRQLHLWRPEGELEGFVMVFTQDFLRGPGSPVGSVYELEFFNSITRSPMLRAPRAKTGVLHDLLGNMSTEFQGRKEGYVSAVRSYFNVFVINLQRMFADELDKSSATREPELARRFKELVSRRFASQLSVQEYADELGVSASRLNSVIKLSTGETPGQLVRRETLIAAKRMLAHSEKNVSEICFELNFEDPSYFGKFFKREAGLTPSEFRDEMREKYHHFPR